MKGMRTLRIFISSPGDVGREREIARRVIPRVEASFGRRIKLEPYFWEHEPMRGTFDPQQNIPDTYDFDIVVCILWSRLGSRLHPGRHQRADGTPYASGTQFEFERAVEGWRVERQPRKPDLLIFQRIEQPSFPPEPRDELLRRSDQWEALKEFIKKWFTDAAEGTFNSSKNEYTSLTEFEDKLEIYLRKIIGQRLAQDEGVQGNLLTVSLVEDDQGHSPTVTVGDEDILVGQIGSYVAIRQNDVHIIAIVTRMTEQEALASPTIETPGEGTARLPFAKRIARLTPIGSIRADGQFDRGVGHRR